MKRHLVAATALMGLAACAPAFADDIPPGAIEAMKDASAQAVLEHGSFVAPGKYGATAMHFSQPGPYQVQAGAIIHYGPGSGDYMTSCTPIIPTNDPWTTKRPAMVLIHGGAWSGGDPGIGDGSYMGYSGSWCRMIASWGVRAYSVSYPLLRNGTEWAAALNGVQAAIRFLRTYSGPLMIDTRLIGAWGDSAGGSLAYQVGYLRTNAPPPPNDPNSGLLKVTPGVSAGAQFVVAAFGPWSWGPNGNGTPLPATIAAAALAQSGPLSQTSETVMIQGLQDNTVAPSQSFDAYCLLKQHNRPVHFLAYQGGHEYTGINGLAPWQKVLDMQTAALGEFLAHGQYAPPGVTPIIPASAKTPGLPADNYTPKCN